jgi:lysophospholipase L1-like esterase
MASRLNHHAGAGSPPWLNFGGRSHNSTQEIVLYALTKHRLPRTEQIVLFSGFNDLGLARLPASVRGESGAFFMCNTFFDRLSGNGNGRLARFRRGRPGDGRDDGSILDLDDQIAYAADLVLRHLDLWRALATDAGAKLTFVLQPLAGWVREVGTSEEEALFAQLDELGRFSDVYGDIARPEVGREYAGQLRKGCDDMGVRFVDVTPTISAAIEPTDWIFVDRIHFTDHGYDLVARLLLEELGG